jgi:hypothetical protein
MTKLKLFAGLAAAITLSFGLLFTGWTLRGWKADRDKAEIVAKAAAQASAAWAEELAGQVEGLAGREGTLKELAEANYILTEKLREAYAANPETRALADTCLPDSVVCLFR